VPVITYFPLFSEVRYSFPYLVSINSVLPAIIAGNAVFLKPSPQTPLTAERFALALTRAGVPQDIIQVLHLSPDLTNYIISRKSIDFVSFTGSVQGGRSVAKTAANALGFTGVALEVGETLALPSGSSKSHKTSLVERTQPTSVKMRTSIIRQLSLLTVSP
jgi:hypothetical protein